MKAFENTRDVSMFGFIKMTIWFVIAIIFFVIGLVTYNNLVAEYEAAISAGSPEDPLKKFGYWMIFGAICCVPVIWQTIKLISHQTRKSAIQGSRHYTTTISSDSTYIYTSTKNHTISEGIIGFFAGAIVSVLMGPIVLPAVMLKELIYLIFCIIWIVKTKKANPNYKVPKNESQTNVHSSVQNNSLETLVTAKENAKHVNKAITNTIEPFIIFQEGLSNVEKRYEIFAETPSLQVLNDKVDGKSFLRFIDDLQSTYEKGQLYVDIALYDNKYRLIQQLIDVPYNLNNSLSEYGVLINNQFTNLTITLKKLIDSENNEIVINRKIVYYSKEKDQFDKDEYSRIYKDRVINNDALKINNIEYSAKENIAFSFTNTSGLLISGIEYEIDCYDSNNNLISSIRKNYNGSLANGATTKLLTTNILNNSVSGTLRITKILFQDESYIDAPISNIFASKESIRKTIFDLYTNGLQTKNKYVDKPIKDLSKSASICIGLGLTACLYWLSAFFSNLLNLDLSSWMNVVFTSISIIPLLFTAITLLIVSIKKPRIKNISKIFLSSFISYLLIVFSVVLLLLFKPTGFKLLANLLINIIILTFLILGIVYSAKNKDSKLGKTFLILFSVLGSALFILICLSYIFMYIMGF